MKTHRSIKLFFQEGTSDKVYNATIFEDPPGKYTVEVQWGRRGSPLNKGAKAVKVALAVAEKTYDKLVREKTGKGYQEITEEVAPAAVAPPEGQGSASRVSSGARKKLGQAAQLLNPVETHEVDALLADDRIIAQQKLDGSRVIVHVRDEVVATNRAGQITSLHTEITVGLGFAPSGTVVDGEVVSGEDGPVYWLFDLLQLGDEDLRDKTYYERYDRLANDLEPGLSGPVRVVVTAMGEEQKRTLFQELEMARAEGIVFKRKDAPYKAGRPASGGTQLKYKFVKTADVFITSNAGNAYRMAVHDGDRTREVGKVFAGTTNESRKELDDLLSAGETPVAEVRYLYATDDKQLFQPVFVRLREDKEPAECTLTQLVQTDRTVRGVS